MVPAQWVEVKSFLKYNIENNKETNLRRVTTKVTVSEAHSVVRIKTALMHIYLDNVKDNSYSGRLIVTVVFFPKFPWPS